MAYSVELLPEAAENLERLDPVLERRIHQKLEWFAKHVDEVPAEPLTGRYRGLYRLRIGSYRAIYSLQRDRHAIVVHAVRHRREAYR